MKSLQRIRVDEYGLLTQTATGRIQRINLEPADITDLKTDVTEGLRRLRDKEPSLACFFDSCENLAARVEIVAESAHCLSRPLRIYYNIEPRCNLRCSFCGPRDLHGRRTNSSQPKEEFILAEIASSGAFQVQLTGGEVFLRGRRLFTTLQRTGELGLATLLGTNGVWRHIRDRDAFVRELANFDHIIEMKVSIDGNREFHDSVRGHGSYDEAVRTVQDLTGAGFPTRINTTIFKKSCTLEQIEHVASLAKKFGAGLQVIPERSCGRSEGKSLYELPAPKALLAYTRRAKELREELGVPISFNFDILGGGRQLAVYDPGRPFSCGAGLWGVAITHLGEVYPCGFAIEIGDPPRFLVGAVNEETSLLDLWLHSPVLAEWRHAGKADACRLCEHYVQTCWGGCMVQAYVTHGSLSAMDPYCLRMATEPELEGRL